MSELAFLLNVLYDFPFYALLSLSFFLSYRVMNFPDLAMDSSYAIGMAILVRCVASHLVPIPITISLLLSLLAGMAIGTLLALLHGIKIIRLSKLLAGLVISFCFFSVLFRLNLNSTSQGLLFAPHEFNYLRDLFVRYNVHGIRQVLFAIPGGCLMLCVVIVYLILRGQYGALLRIAGHRPALLVESGRYPILFMICGLGGANAISAFAGCLRASVDNYADINTFGTFLFALAGLLLGERIIGASSYGRSRAHRLEFQIMTPIIGGLAMSFLVQFSIWLLNDVLDIFLAADIKLVLGLAVFLSAGKWKKEINPRINDDSI